MRSVLLVYFFLVLAVVAASRFIDTQCFGRGEAEFWFQTVAALTAVVLNLIVERFVPPLRWLARHLKRDGWFGPFWSSPSIRETTRRWVKSARRMKRRVIVSIRWNLRQR